VSGNKNVSTAPNRTVAPLATADRPDGVTTQRKAANNSCYSSCPRLIEYGPCRGYSRTYWGVSQP